MLIPIFLVSSEVLIFKYHFCINNLYFEGKSNSKTQIRYTCISNSYLVSMLCKYYMNQKPGIFLQSKKNHKSLTSTLLLDFRFNFHT